MDEDDVGSLNPVYRHHNNHPRIRRRKLTLHIMAILPPRACMYISPSLPTSLTLGQSIRTWLRVTVRLYC